MARRTFTRKKKKGANRKAVAEMQPDELNELKKVALEYVNRLQTIDNEIETLREDKKTLKDEFSEKLDIKTLEAALKALKIESTVQHRDTFDTFVEALKEEV